MYSCSCLVLERARAIFINGGGSGTRVRAHGEGGSHFYGGRGGGGCGSRDSGGGVVDGGVGRAREAAMPWIYHEKQESALCGQHALNNLMQVRCNTPRVR